MNSDFTILRTRREFVRQAACAALGTLGLTSAIRDLRLINSAAAQGNLTDYKALVCIFLNGGNDANNLVIPRGADYESYAAIRQNLAIPLTSLHSINPLNEDGHDYGFHPNCLELKTLFDEGKCALLYNVGVLSYPMTRDQYQRGTVPRPPQLFSHSDQVTQWMTSIPDQPPKSGWGGRVADLLHPGQLDMINGIPGPNAAKIALCTSISGANTFEVGNLFQQYHVSTSGAVLLTGTSADLNTAEGRRLRAIKDVLAVPSPNLQQEAYTDVVERAVATGELLNNNIAATAASSYWTVPFPSTTLGNQLRMVARLIHARSPLNMRRQIFFCSVGGYDTHTAQTLAADPTQGSHANLLNELSEAVFAFQRAIEQIALEAGQDTTLPSRVTSFTASDFGRTFPTNGAGSDHGWGNHQIIVGGAVRGNRTYGTFPVHQVNGPDDTSTGRWIPRTSVDEYSATLAKWFGVAPGSLGTVFPNLGRFSSPDLGFML